jgi:hypothetical protein
MPDEQIIQMQALEIVKLKAQLAESQARECRMREQILTDLPLLRRYVSDMGPMHSNGCSLDDTCDCAAKPIHDAVQRMCCLDEALSASGPCPHAGEVERLRKLCGDATPWVRQISRFVRLSDYERDQQINLLDILEAAAEGREK